MAARNDPRKKPTPVVVKKPAAKAEPRARKPRIDRADRDQRGRDRGDLGERVDRGEGPKFVGGPRNEFGTRIARRVTCARCGTSDHVPYVPRDPTKALCRKCAMEVLATYEAGVKVRMPTKPTKCNLCGKPFNLPITADDDGDPLCPSCLKGFTDWQGSVDVPFEERENVVVEERLSGALVRKRKKSE